MKKDNFTFELIDTLAPDVVIKNAIKQIEEVTEGYVIGGIEVYDGPIQNYKKRTGLASALGTMQMVSEVEVSIQEYLGEQGAENHKFEIYLCAKELNHYKYRVMFLEYGTVSYPAKIVLNDDFALACFGKYTSTFQVETMAELEELVNTVLESDIMIKLIQSIIYESLRKEKQKGNLTNAVKDED